MVCKTDLLAVLPRRFVEACGAADALHITALPFPMPRIEIGLLWHRRHERDAAQRWLREAIVRVAPGDC